MVCIPISDNAVIQKRIRRRLAARGVINNLVVMIRFSNHVNRVLPVLKAYETVFNTGGDPNYAPAGSVRGMPDAAWDGPWRAGIHGMHAKGVIDMASISDDVITISTTRDELLGRPRVMT